MRTSPSGILLRAILLAGVMVTVAGAETPPRTMVQNDGYFGGSVGFQDGLVAGDIVAARLPYLDGDLIGIGVYFSGGDPSQEHAVTLKIWHDVGTHEPGAELYSGAHAIWAQDEVQYISLPAGIAVPSSFRVGIVLHADAPPSVAHDLDGTITGDYNFIYNAADGWHRSAEDGVTGDWIIRAESNGGGGGGGGGGCFGSSCTPGQLCDPEVRACVTPCSEDTDCPAGGTCDGRGRCAGGDGAAVGCGCRSSADGRTSLALALGLGLFVVRRRRGR